MTHPHLLEEHVEIIMLDLHSLSKQHIYKSAGPKLTRRIEKSLNLTSFCIRERVAKVIFKVRAVMFIV